MVGNFAVVHKKWFRRQGLVHQPSGQRLIGSDGTRLQTLLKGGDNIRAQIPGIGSGIGQDFMVLIEALHNVQRILGRIIKPLIGIPLQLRQVIEKGRLRLFRRPLYLSHNSRLPLKLLSQSLHPAAVKGTVAACPCILPCKDQAVFSGLKPKVWLGHKRAYLRLPFCYHGQSRGLDTAAGKLGIVFAGQGPGGVDAHQPVRLCPAHGCVIQVIVFPSVLQVRKSLPDSLIRHG